MVPENPHPWEVFSDVIGWVYFVAWSVSFYPQVYTNWSRKSVIGLSFDFELFNILGFSCVSIYNSVFLWGPTVRSQYAARFNGEQPQVAINDVIFGIHAFVLTAVHLLQIAIYERGTQKFSYFSRTFVVCAISAASLYSILIATAGVPSWLDLMYVLSWIKISLSFFKYIPQVYLNYARKSTVGWNIYNILLDLTGGVLSLAQLIMDCWLSDNWEGITGNPLKLFMSLTSLLFDVIFIVQHYCLYPETKEKLYAPEEEEALVNHADDDETQSAQLFGKDESPTEKMWRYTKLFFAQSDS